MKKFEGVPTLELKEKEQEEIFEFNYEQKKILKEIFGSKDPEIFNKKYENIAELNAELMKILDAHKLEKQLKNPKLPKNIDVLYEPLDKEGGGDGYQIEGNKISLFDIAGHGKNFIGIKTLVNEVWKYIIENIPEKDWYQELDELLLGIKEKTGLTAGLSTSLGMVKQLENGDIELFNPAGEIFIIIQNSETGEIKLELSEEVIKHKAKLGQISKYLKDTLSPKEIQENYVCEKIVLPKDSQILMFTDGVMSGDWGYDWGEIEKFVQNNQNLSKQDFYTKFKNFIKEHLENTQDDDVTMICLNPK